MAYEMAIPPVFDKKVSEIGWLSEVGWVERSDTHSFGVEDD